MNCKSLIVFAAIVCLVSEASAQSSETTPLFRGSKANSSTSYTKPTAKLPSVLDLETALRIALDNNLTIQLAKERIEEQDKLTLDFVGASRPQVNLTGTYVQIDEDLDEGGFPGAIVRDRNWSVSIEATQSIYSGGADTAAIKGQEKNRDAAVMEMRSTVQDVLLAVRQQFFTVLLARDTIAVEEANIELFKEQLTFAKNRFDAGSVSNFDVLRAEVDLANAQPPLIRARNDYRNAIDRLMQLIGLTTTSYTNYEEIEVAGDLSYNQIDVDVNKAISTALNERVEIQRFLLLEGSAEQNIRLVQSEKRPSVTAFANYDLQKSSFSNDFGDSIHGWMAGVQFSWNIWDSGRRTNQVLQAISQKRQVQIQADELELNIEVEVRNAVNSLIEADELVTAARRTVERAEESLRLARARYQAGQSTQLDVTQAQVSLTVARNNELQAKFSHEIALANYRRATGLADRDADSTYDTVSDKPFRHGFLEMFKD